MNSHWKQRPEGGGRFAAHEILHLRAYRAVLAEGTQHAGESALIDCVVRKC